MENLLQDTGWVNITVTKGTCGYRKKGNLVEFYYYCTTTMSSEKLGIIPSDILPTANPDANQVIVIFNQYPSSAPRNLAITKDGEIRAHVNSYNDGSYTYMHDLWIV